jgi:glycosyltransferase involved in cell wall biosynthesis
MEREAQMFSVIIATCGRPERLTNVLGYLGTAITRYGKSCPVVIADNDPGYPAEKIVREYVLPLASPLIYLKTEPRNKSAALNAAIQAAPTDWLAFTDDDTEPTADWLLEGQRYLELSEVRVAGGRVVPGAPSGSLPSWLVAGRSGRIPHGGYFVHYEPQSVSGILATPASVPYGANVFIHKSVFRDFGLYDEVLWRLCGKAALGVDDGEFGVRIQTAGEPIGYCHEAVVVHPVHDERISIRDHLRFAYRYGWRDPMVFFDPQRPLVEWFRFRRILVLLGEAWCDWLGGDPASALAYMGDAMKCWGGFCNRWSKQFREWREIRIRNKD